MCVHSCTCDTRLLLLYAAWPGAMCSLGCLNALSLKLSMRLCSPAPGRRARRSRSGSFSSGSRSTGSSYSTTDSELTPPRRGVPPPAGAPRLLECIRSLACELLTDWPLQTRAQAGEALCFVWAAFVPGCLMTGAARLRLLAIVLAPSSTPAFADTLGWAMVGVVIGC